MVARRHKASTMARSAATSGFINHYCLVRDHPIGDRLKFFIRQTRTALGYSYGRLRLRLGEVEPKGASHSFVPLLANCIQPCTPPLPLPLPLPLPPLHFLSISESHTEVEAL